MTPPGFVTDGGSGGSWSPRGNKIPFDTAAGPSMRASLWIARADGSRLHQVPVTPACGGPIATPTATRCFQPGWSPNGQRTVFGRTNPNGTFEIYTVGAGGRGLARVTRSGRAFQPDWGPRPSSLADRPLP
jgi:Tol biopolymer transport system component